jgi:hypothetical protein
MILILTVATGRVISKDNNKSNLTATSATFKNAEQKCLKYRLDCS